MKNGVGKGIFIALLGLIIMAVGCLSASLEFIPQIVSGGIIVLGGVFFLGGAAIVDKSEKKEEG